MFQNSPEVDDEGYSIRPEEESEGGGHILNNCFMCYLTALVSLNVFVLALRTLKAFYWAEMEKRNLHKYRNNTLVILLC